MKLQKYFDETIANNILKSRKLSIILLGFIGVAPNDNHLNPYIFQAHGEVQHYAFANKPRAGPDFLPNASLYQRNFVEFVGKHPILQITPEE